MKQRFAFSLGLLLLVLNAPLSAQDCSSIDGRDCAKAIQTAVPFLRIVADARSGAMGDVGIALSPDANAIPFNTSKLAFVENDVGISATYTPWLRALGLSNVYLAYLSAYKRIDKLQTLALGLRYFSLGDVALKNITIPTGKERSNELELTLGYARQLSPNFSVAINPKFIYSNSFNGETINNIELEPGLAGAADFSMTYRKEIKSARNPSNLTLAAAITNLGTKISYAPSTNKDFLPANLGIGAAWQLYLNESNSLTIAVDINKLLVPTSSDSTAFRDLSAFSGALKSFGDAPGGAGEEFKELMYSIGLEYWYNDQFALRAGYYKEDKDKGNRNFFTAGFGFQYKFLGANVAYLVASANQRSPLDNTLRFSLLFNFSALEQGES